MLTPPDGVRFRTEITLYFQPFMSKFETGVATTRALHNKNNRRALGLV
jgi:hypothetical protein